ncbi:hypothetical protein EW146_g8984, partial [Bondarzewia mesenterica]
PNRRLDFDLKSLHLHLSARVSEVLACAETMWAWVEAFQDGERERSVVERDRRVSLSEDEAMRREVMALSRAEFDMLLTRFELDMQDSMALDSCIESNLHWALPMTTRTQERKEFEQACGKWDKYEERRRRSRSKGRGRTQSPLASRPSLASVDGRGRAYEVNEEDGEESRAQGDGTPSQRLSRTIRVFCAWKP